MNNTPSPQPPVLAPSPSGSIRDNQAKQVRHEAAGLSSGSVAQQANDDLDVLPDAAATYTKALPHDAYGRVDPSALHAFVDFLNQARPASGSFRMPDRDGMDVMLGPPQARGHLPETRSDTFGLPRFVTGDHPVRRLESPLAGHAFSLQGPDADAVHMPPAPRFGSGELAAELAEVYALALLRDDPFQDIAEPGANTRIRKIVDDVLSVGWFHTADDSPRAEARRQARAIGGPLDARRLFRGSTRGAQAGPYISQFMLVGSADIDPSDAAGEPEAAPSLFTLRRSSTLRFAPGPLSAEASEAREGRIRPQDGLILYGVQTINQRYRPHLAGVDHLTRWAEWIDVQNGADVGGDRFEEQPRFITTPRDLATYVHYDALYQAYLNACLLLLSYGHPFDSGLPETAVHDYRPRTGFATFGGPHILSLVAEVATRALKAVRRQKFNIHLRARPEAIAGVLTHAASAPEHANRLADVTRLEATNLLSELEPLLTRIDAHNAAQNARRAQDLEEDAERTRAMEGWIADGPNYLLPMAFPEGSPTHASYGAGHATVAGACVTILKAFFEMFEGPTSWRERSMKRLYGADEGQRESLLGPGPANRTCIFQPTRDGQALRELSLADLGGAELTVLGELDKLAANISIGRDMAGVHYYTDYYESLRMGERIAVRLLQEQMLTYPEEVHMRLLTFDGLRMTLSGHGDGRTATVRIEDPAGGTVDVDDWVRG